MIVVLISGSAAGIAFIYFTYYLRALRWAVFVSPTRKISPFSILAPQFIGFTAVALFGRLADVIRPALIAKRVQLSVSSQIAVWYSKMACSTPWLRSA